MTAPVETKTATGRVVRVIGPVVDAEFPRDAMPALFNALLHVPIPVEAKTYYLGGITLFLFMVQVATGTLLSLYYKPTPEAAYDSVKYITSIVEFGWLIRSIASSCCLSNPLPRLHLSHRRGRGQGSRARKTCFVR